MRYPSFLAPGDVVGVTSPSSGVPHSLQPRLDAAIADVESHGFAVRVGDCMGAEAIASAPAEQRAGELMGMLLDPVVKAIVPPWGGEIAIDLLEHLDFDAISNAEPTWVVGYSDMSTIITPLTCLTGIATIHGVNLMDTPYRPADGMIGWLDIVSGAVEQEFSQISRGRHRSSGWDDYSVPARETPREFTLDARSPWSLLCPGKDGVSSMEGRLIGGCIEVLSPFSGSSYLDVEAWRKMHCDGDATIVYLEAAEANAAKVFRSLMGMRYCGLFDGAAGVLVGRTRSEAVEGFTHDDAVRDALSPLGVPVIAGVDCGHVPPYMPFINGARASVTLGDGVGRVVQQLV